MTFDSRIRYSGDANGIRVAHTSAPKVGERANGDRALFRSNEARQALLVIVDALGHGPGADEVSSLAIKRLAEIPLNLPVLAIMEMLHADLHGTRGAAATICRLDGRQFEACAVGNVELRCSEAALPFMFSPGILGIRVRKFRVCDSQLPAPCRLVMFSDGISTRVRLEDVRRLPPAEACALVLERHRRNEDDATVLIADVE